jgi:thiamine biosynthesis lipoprotein
MKETRLIMGMPVTIQIPLAHPFGGSSSFPQTPQGGIGRDLSPQMDANNSLNNTIAKAFDYFTYIDNTFSTYKENSEIMKINRGELKLEDASKDMREIFRLAEQTKNETGGYFDIVNHDGKYDPSGIVKGWAINNAAKLIREDEFENYYVEAGGDIQVNGTNDKGEKWAIGIKNPLNQSENVKVVYLTNEGIATSGTYIRGQHIYNPHDRNERFDDIVSLSVIGLNIYEADRFATAAFAMGRKGIEFIEGMNKEGEPRTFEGYMVDSKGIATMTSEFEKFTKKTTQTYPQ